MSINPMTMLGGSSGAGAMGGMGSWLNIALQALQAGKSINDLAGPKGALRTGDITQGGQAVQNLYSSSRDLFAPSDPNPGPKVPTTQGAFKMTPEQFMGLPPEVREKMLRQLSEETNAFGSIR
jgi:hypothetical protein